MHPSDESEILKVTAKMKRTTSTCIDGVSSYLVKYIPSFISLPFSHICNLALSTVLFPDSMKLSKVIPIYNSGEVNVLNNYRLISLLPKFSKILERIVYNRLYDHLTSQRAITNKQFGFRPNHSPELALLHATELPNSLCEEKKVSLGVYVDLSTAFDCIEHEILVYKLKRYGVR